MNLTHEILDGRSKTQILHIKEDNIYIKFKKQLKLNYMFWGTTNINGKNDIEKQGKGEYKFKLVLPGGGVRDGEDRVISHEQPALKERFYFSV